MKITVASGKGGTGKTTIAVALAVSLAEAARQNNGRPVAPLFLDCDVEAPNAHLFLKPDLKERKQVGVLIPQIDETRCTHCGKCAEVCQYHAVAVLGKKTLVFPQLCHGCGSCAQNCPEGAIREVLNPLGTLEAGITPAGIRFGHGRLNVGEPMAVPVIRQLKRWIQPKPGQALIVDASPGASCSVVEAARGSDFLLLVSEPTPFGLHDLKLAAEVAREMAIPAGVVLNRYDGAAQNTSAVDQVENYCRAEKLPVLARIPFQREIAAGIAQGKTLIEIHPEFTSLFAGIAEQIALMIEPARASTPDVEGEFHRIGR